VKEHGVSIARACTLVKLSRTARYRRPASRMEGDRSVIDMLNEILARRPRWGFWTLHQSQAHRVYCALGLNLPRRTKRRLPTRPRQPRRAPIARNETWALDLMADALYGDHWFRTLNVIDEGNRQTLGSARRQCERIYIDCLHRMVSAAADRAVIHRTWKAR